MDNAPFQVNAGSSPVSAETYQQLMAQFSQTSSEKAKLALQLDALQYKLARNDELDKLIKPYAKSSFRFMCAYCMFSGVVLVASGFQWKNFTLADGVLQTLIGSTAVAVIGLVGMVLTGVFVGARGK